MIFPYFSIFFQGFPIFFHINPRDFRIFPYFSIILRCPRDFPRDFPCFSYAPCGNLVVPGGCGGHLLWSVRFLGLDMIYIYICMYVYSNNE